MQGKGTSNIDGLAQDCNNAIANAPELLLSCANLSIFNVMFLQAMHIITPMHAYIITEAYFKIVLYWDSMVAYPDSKVHGADMGPIWGRRDPCEPHVDPMNFAIWVQIHILFCNANMQSTPTYCWSMQSRFGNVYADNCNTNTASAQGKQYLFSGQCLALILSPQPIYYHEIPYIRIGKLHAYTKNDGKSWRKYVLSKLYMYWYIHLFRYGEMKT